MNLKTFRSLLASTVVVVPLFAQAQTKAPVPATPPPPATAAPVPVTPEGRAAIKELLDAMNMRESLTKSFPGMLQALVPQMGQAVARQVEGNTTLTPEQKSKVLEGMKVPFEGALKEAQGILSDPKLVDETMNRMVPVYSKYFTIAEIKQITAFYKTPVGAKTITTMPQAFGESLQATFIELQPRIAAVIDKLVKTQVDAVTKK